LGLIFECRGIATAVPIIIDKTEVRLDVHIYPIIDFNLLLGFPLEELLGTSQGSLDEKLRKTASATFCLKNPLAKPQQYLLEMVIHISPIISSEPADLMVQNLLPLKKMTQKTFLKMKESHHP
jgi:hypothetical protein